MMPTRFATRSWIACAVAAAAAGTLGLLGACDRGSTNSSSSGAPAGAVGSTAASNGDARAPDPPANNSEHAAATQTTDAPDHDSHGHSHTAPHGGALVCVGDHVAHVEWVFDPAAGRLTLYVLDGEASGGVRLAHPTLDVRVQPTADGKPQGEAIALTLDAVANTLTGEKVGDSSQFTAASEKLIGIRALSGQLARAEIRGITITDLAFEIVVERSSTERGGHE